MPNFQMVPAIASCCQDQNGISSGELETTSPDSRAASGHSVLGLLIAARNVHVDEPAGPPEDLRAG
ncbi:hypothetical protein NLX62_01015, partial [Mycobacteriaceae bacterium Msp059]|nr:hypothetical protein [Mycobacteriaceae bacterium Msp059]